MDLTPDDLKSVDPLALSNTVTLSALVALLVKKGILSDEELVREIRALRARLGSEPKPGANP